MATDSKTAVIVAPMTRVRKLDIDALSFLLPFGLVKPLLSLMLQYLAKYPFEVDHSKSSFSRGQRVVGIHALADQCEKWRVNVTIPPSVPKVADNHDDSDEEEDLPRSYFEAGVINHKTGVGATLMIPLCDGIAVLNHNGQPFMTSRDLKMFNILDYRPPTEEEEMLCNGGFFPAEGMKCLPCGGKMSILFSSHCECLECGNRLPPQITGTIGPGPEPVTMKSDVSQIKVTQTEVYVVVTIDLVRNIIQFDLDGQATHERMIKCQVPDLGMCHAIIITNSAAAKINVHLPCDPLMANK